MNSNEIPLPLVELVARSRKIGSDQSLVVYGGGNTSSKGKILDHFGRPHEVMWVKGSGSDMMYGGERDYPALYLDDLRELISFDDLDDETMVDYVTRALVDPTSRRPSIETLLHAFLPAKHIDHVHADAICALTNHPAGAKAVADALGSGFEYVDWMIPGFTLSKIVSKLKDSEGIVLAHHGLVVWDESSDRCLEKTHEAVAKADKFLDSLTVKPVAAFDHGDMPQSELNELLLQLRGKLGKKQILRTDTRLRQVASRNDLDKIVEASTSSADHMLRIRPKSALIKIEAPEESIDSYRSDYAAYFERNKSRLQPGYSSHGNDPKVLLVPNVGAVTSGVSQAECSMLADIALHTHSVAARVIDSFGEADTIPESEVFGFDYWPMELFKLSSKPAPAKFAGSIFVVTGAGSGIGRGIAIELGRLGASLTLADLDEKGLEEVRGVFKENKWLDPLLMTGDQSSEEIVSETLNQTIANFGGLDGVVINAGIGVSDNLEELSVEKFRRGLDINLTSAFLMTKGAMQILRKQGLGGSIVYIASKNAFAPGAGFGGYSVTKAGMLQLMRIAAIEGGSVGIRANAINPDAVFDNSKLWEGGIRDQRAAAHGVKPEDLEDFYASRNILKVRVQTVDVAHSVSFLLSDDSSRTTGAVIAVDGGVSAAFPR
jgi:rhamnose utilization protein RhaD (predicted bifunctional aldolase and dehydrogenase)/NAD(P)-dependent dehydrogenase (short-subunit alcohol dehydrogenase family)